MSESAKEEATALCYCAFCACASVGNEKFGTMTNLDEGGVQFDRLGAVLDGAPVVLQLKMGKRTVGQHFHVRRGQVE